jgi:transposase
MIDSAVVARIRALYFGEHWKVGTIAAELGLHPSTVQGWLTDRVGWPRVPRASPVDAYRSFIEQTLEQHPRLRATRVFEMLRVRGYAGPLRTVRRVVRTLRPRSREAFLELRTFPGEQGQVDWAHFGKVRVRGGERALSCFVVTLSWSRAIYFEFFYDQSQESFLTGHVRAFRHFGGVPRVLLYDNLRSAVLERMGAAVRFHPRLLDLCGHYHFQPRPCGVRRGNEKGRVERAIRYIRESFFAARSFSSLQDLNAQASAWMREIADARPFVEDARRTVADAWEEEHPLLLRLPEHDFDTDRILPVSAGKTIYVAFDGNRYSIPPTAVERALSLVVNDRTVRIIDGATEIARHARSFDRGQRIGDPAHEEAVLASKRRAGGAVRSSRLLQAVPEYEDFLARAFERGESAYGQTRQLLELLERFGPRELRAAVQEAIARDTTRASSVAFIAKRRQRARGSSVSHAVDLTRRPELADIHVSPHAPETYDDLSSFEPAAD